MIASFNKNLCRRGLGLSCLRSRFAFCNKSQTLEMVEAGVFEVLKSANKVKVDKLTREATMEELGFDSLDQVELVVAMEERFKVNLTDDDSLKIKSVMDAIQVFNSYLSKAEEKTEVESKI